MVISLSVGIVSLLLLITILIFPETALAGAAQGLLLWFNRVVPALLPCMALTQLCIRSGLLEKIISGGANKPGQISHLTGYGIYTAVLGLLCGFPMGAKLVHDFYMDKKLSRREALLLLSFCSQLSPAFLTGYVLADDLLWKSYRYLIILSYYMSVLSLWFLISRIIPRCPESCAEDNILLSSASSHTVKKDPQEHVLIRPAKKEVSRTFCLSENLDTSIMNSMDTILRIGGYIILFSVLAAVSSHCLPMPPVIAGSCISLIEITSGLEQLNACTLSPILRPVLTNTLCAFGGVSSLLQVCGVLKGTDLPVQICFIAKAGQALLTGLFTGLFLFFVL